MRAVKGVAYSQPHHGGGVKHEYLKKEPMVKIVHPDHSSVELTGTILLSTNTAVALSSKSCTHVSFIHMNMPARGMMTSARPPR